LNFLKANKTLKVLHWDGNQTSKNGFRKFLTGLQANYSLETMPLPHQDISLVDLKIDKFSSQAIRNWSELLNQIEEKLKQNSAKHTPLSPTKQIVKRMVTVIDHSWNRIDESYNIPLSGFPAHVEKLKENIDPFTKGLDLEFNVIYFYFLYFYFPF
jgi:hypothetical protein